MPVPAHQTIRDELVAQIASGALEGGARLDGETQLASRFGVTRMTVRHALTGMVNDGLLVRRQGVGTFVAQDAARRNMSRLTGFSEDMSHEGRTVSTRVLAQQIVPAFAPVALALDIEEGQHVTHCARLRSTDGRPLISQYSWVRLESFPALWETDLVGGSLYATLHAGGVELRRAEQRVAAESADAEQAALLEIAEGTPLLRIERTAHDARNVPVEFARSWMRPGFEITTHIER